MFLIISVLFVSGKVFEMLMIIKQNLSIKKVYSQFIYLSFLYILQNSRLRLHPKVLSFQLPTSHCGNLISRPTSRLFPAPVCRLADLSGQIYINARKIDLWPPRQL